MDTHLISDRAVNRYLAEGFEALSGTERLLVAVWGLEADVNNGGFDQYFSNSYGDYSLLAERSLRKIGAHQMADIVAQARSVFGPDGPPVARAQREDALIQLPEGSFDAFDSRFWPYPDDISALLSQFLQRNGYAV